MNRQQKATHQTMKIINDLNLPRLLAIDAGLIRPLADDARADLCRGCSEGLAALAFAGQCAQQKVSVDLPELAAITREVMAVIDRKIADMKART